MKKERWLEAALDAVRCAARVCEGARGQRQTLVKGDASPVTVADFAVQAVISSRLARLDGGLALVAEESAAQLREASGLLPAVSDLCRQALGDPGFDPLVWLERGRAEAGGRFWTIDPIDGTKGFSRGDQYAIAVALVDEGRVELGALGCPALDGGQMFWASAGGGAFCAALSGANARRLQVDRQASPRLVEGVEAGHADHARHARLCEALGFSSSPLRVDSQVKYGLLARGEASLFLRLPHPAAPTYQEKLWDHTAGTLILEEAGGVVTDSRGERLHFDTGRLLERNLGVIASDNRHHERIVAAVAALKG